MTGGSEVQDPLRFGEAEEDLQDEVPLHDEPLLEELALGHAGAAAAAAAAAPPAVQHPAVAVPSHDPLTSISAQPAVVDPYARPPPPVAHPAVSPVAAALGGAPLSLVGSSAGRSDIGEIQSEDSTWLQGGAAAFQGAAPAMKITVTDPVKRVSDSIIPGVKGGHYEYLVTTVSQHPRRRVEVRRRFNDFVALADLLSTAYRGCFVFPRPDKNSLEGQMGKKDFIETRRSDLERYLNKLAGHPLVGRSEALQVFLEGEGPLANSFAWQQLQPLKGSLLEGVARLPRQWIGSDSSVPSSVEAAQNARNTSDLRRRLREAGERMRQEYKAPPTLPDDEVKLRGERTVVEEYQEKVAVASRKAEKVVRQFEELGAVLGDLGLGLIKLAKFEDEVGASCGQYSDWGAASKTMAADTRRVGMSSVRLSRLSRTATSHVMESLEPLHDELALAPAVAGALREREAALLTVQCIEEDIAKKKKAVEHLEESGSRVFGGDKAKTRKVAGLHNDLAALEAALGSAKSEYERVKGRNNEELERWRGEKAGDYLRMGRGFAQVNTLYEERSAQVWKGVAEDMGAGQLLEQKLTQRRG